MAIDESTKALLAAAAATGQRPLHELTPVEARAGSVGSAAMYGTGPEMHRIDNHDVDLAGGPCGLRVLMPSAEPAAVLLYFHGGGWVLGDIDGSDALGRKIAATTNVTVVLVNYRKAPESPFPAAVEDAWAALGWVDVHRTELAAAGAPILIGGDSAGGNLAIVTALRSRDRSGPVIEFAALVYPVTDSDMTRGSYTDPTNQLMLSKDTMEWFFSHYVGDRDRTHPEISPIRTGDLTGFPATVVLTAQHDPLRDEGVAFAERLAGVGSLVELREFEAQMHGFFGMVGVLPESAVAIDFVTEHINRYLNGRGYAQ